MLLAAGRGERMRPLTDNTAKPLLKANGTRLIEFHLHNLRTAGFTDVIINTSWQGKQVSECLGDGTAYGVSIVYSHEPEALETAGGIANVQSLLGHEPFLLISADIWCDINFNNIHPPAADSLARLVLVNNPPHHPTGDFGLDGERVIAADGNRTYTYSGIGCFDPALFTLALGKKMRLLEVLTPMIARARIHGQYHAGKWMDIGTPERLEALDKHLKDELSGTGL